MPRSTFESLTDVSRGIEAAVADIDLMNFGTAKNQLKAVQWHVGEAKKRIKTVGGNRKGQP